MINTAPLEFTPTQNRIAHDLIERLKSTRPAYSNQTDGVCVCVALRDFVIRLENNEKVKNGISKSPAFLDQALNEGEGVYQP